MTNAEIARIHLLTEATIKTHVTRVLTKLGLLNRVETVTYAYESGLPSRQPSGLTATGEHPPVGREEHVGRVGPAEAPFGHAHGGAGRRAERGPPLLRRGVRRDQPGSRVVAERVTRRPGVDRDDRSAERGRLEQDQPDRLGGGGEGHDVSSTVGLRQRVPAQRVRRTSSGCPRTAGATDGGPARHPRRSAGPAARTARAPAGATGRSTSQCFSRASRPTHTTSSVRSRSAGVAPAAAGGPAGENTSGSTPGGQIDAFGHAEVVEQVEPGRRRGQGQVGLPVRGPVQTSGAADA